MSTHIEPVYERDGIRVYHGDNREVVSQLGEQFAACVTDPPYGLTANKKGGSGVASINLDSPYGRARIGTGNGPGGFMGKKWDGTAIERDPEFWSVILDALLPGAHLLAFGGTRTFHRIACAIEDAGFEIRDTLQWLYGSGFPKSLDVSKAIDKAAGAEREVIGAKRVTRDLARDGRTGDEAISPVPVHGATVDITAPATDAARDWQGWGTALKPAYEPVLTCCKPLQAEQFLAIITDDVRRLLCLLSPANDAESLWNATRARSSEVADSVLASARTYELANSENVWFAASRFTCTDPDSSGETGSSAPFPARGSGSPSTTPESETPLGRVESFTTRLVATCMSGEMVDTWPNIVSSWNSISDDLLSQASTFTTSTGTRLTTALTTLRSSLQQIISGDTGSSNRSNLTPDNEPIILARKPLQSTVAANVLAHGTGALNIDQTRVRPASPSGFDHSGGPVPVSLQSVQDAARHIAAALRACNNDGTDPSRAAAGLDGTPPSDVRYAEILNRLYPNGALRALSWTEAQGSPDDCPSCRRFGDAHVRSVREAAQAGAPSLADALDGIGSALHERAHTQCCCGYTDRPSSCGAVRQIAALLNLLAPYYTSSDVERGRAGEASANTRYTERGGTNFAPLPGIRGGDPAGRWPPNVILDPAAAAALDQMSGENRLRIGKPRKSVQPGNGYGMTHTGAEYNDQGGSSRFFPVLPIDDPDTERFLYSPKASRRERNAGLDGLPERPSYMVENGSKTAGAANGVRYERHTVHQNHHPTCKPVSVMSWLLTLVTPPGGVVLDPFAGSGTTGVAAVALGIPCVLIEQEAEYLPIIIGRIDHALNERLRKPRLKGLY